MARIPRRLVGYARRAYGRWRPASSTSLTLLWRFPSFVCRREIALRPCQATAGDNTAFGSMSGIGFVLSGLLRGLTKWRSLTITETA